MKQFIAFVKKEFYHIFRDRRTMLILLGMPVVQIILFGFAISTEVKNVRLAVLDPSNDVVTRKIIDRLDASEYFTVTTRFHSPQEMETAFRKNKIDMAIVFGERFADGLYTGDARVQLIVDATDPNMSTSQSNYAASIVSSAGQEMLPPNVFVSRLTPDVKLLYNPQMKSAYNFVPGVMGLILMLICAMMTSISIVRWGLFFLFISGLQLLSAQEDSTRFTLDSMLIKPKAAFQLPSVNLLPEKTVYPLINPIQLGDLPSFSLKEELRIPYHINPSPLFRGDYSTGGVLRQFPHGAVFGSGSQTSVPGIGRFNNASLGYQHIFNDRLSLQLRANAMKINMSHITGQAFSTIIAPE